MNLTMLSLPCLASFLLFGAEAPRPLQGTWQATAAQRNGAEAPDIVGHFLTIDGDKFNISKKGKVLYEGKLKVQADKKPAQIDFEQAKKTWQGIYKLEKGMLTICDNGADPSKPRPTTFATKADSGHVLVTFKRADE